MKNVFKFSIIIFILLLANLELRSQNPLFNDSIVPTIYVELSPDSLSFMIDNLANDHYFESRFIFDDGTIRDTFESTGIRLRGNTSLLALKKSFKLSFNEFVSGGRYRGVKKLNLRGSHNDPTMMREKLFYEIWNKFGMPKRRVNFIKLFINNEYRGLYSNVEEIDKEWLERAFDEKDGNLYKCTYPADLVYKGANQAAYKAILNNPTTRAYDLTTNDSLDNYGDLVNLISTLNQPNNTSFPAKIEQVLNVQSVLKSFAIDIATGNWDDYFYNKNNYYLYHNLTTDKFEFVTFDTDNSIGVDWLGKDWATRDALKWQIQGESRPLAAKLLAVPAYKQLFIQYLDSLAKYYIAPDSIFPRIDELHQLITPAAISDTYRTLDYGYTIDDFNNGITQTIDSHTPYGIKPFFELRRDSMLAQIDGLISSSSEPTPDESLQIFPNPTKGQFSIGIEMEENPLDLFLFDTNGHLVFSIIENISHEMNIGEFPNGFYYLQVKTATENKVVKILLIH